MKFQFKNKFNYTITWLDNSCQKEEKYEHHDVWNSKKKISAQDAYNLVTTLKTINDPDKKVIDIWIHEYGPNKKKGKNYHKIYKYGFDYIEYYSVI